MPLKLKAGCYYRRRDGEIRGPIASFPGRAMRWELPHDKSWEGSWDEFGAVCPGVESPGDLIAEVPAPTKPKARKRTGRKMVTRWAMIVRSGIGTMHGWLGDSRQEARSKRAYLIREGLSCGPITRITLPAPAGRGKK